MLWYVGIVILSAISLVLVVLGGGSAGWKRACLFMAHAVNNNWAWGSMSSKAVEDVTPAFVRSRLRSVLAVWAISAVISLCLFRWYWAIAYTIGMYIAMELAACVFPKKDNPYYVLQSRNDLRTYAALAQRVGDAQLLEEVKAKLQRLDDAFDKNGNATALGNGPSRPTRESQGPRTRTSDADDESIMLVFSAVLETATESILDAHRLPFDNGSIRGAFDRLIASSRYRLVEPERWKLLRTVRTRIDDFRNIDPSDAAVVGEINVKTPSVRARLAEGCETSADREWLRAAMPTWAKYAVAAGKTS